MKTRLKLLSLLFCLAIVSVQGQGQPPNDDYAKALQVYSTNEFQLALPAFNKVIENNPKNFEAYIYRGNCYAYLHQFKSAEKDFMTADRHLKNNELLDFGYGYMYNEKGDYKRAMEYLDKAIALNPKNAQYFNARGISFQRLGNARKAIENYSTAIKLDSNLALAYSNRGTAIYENQDVDAASSFDIRTAIKDFNRAIKIEPSLCIALRNRGMAYSFINQYKLALDDLNQAIACEGKNADYYLNRGSVYTSLGRYTDAIQDFKYALVINGKFAEAYILMGEAFFKEGSIQDALLCEMKAGMLDKTFRGLADFNSARYYCSSKDKMLMMKYLKLAEKYGYFKPLINLANFLKDAEFLPYKQDTDFDKFRNSVRGNRL